MGQSDLSQPWLRIDVLSLRIVLVCWPVELVIPHYLAVAFANAFTSNKPNQKEVSGMEIELLDTIRPLLMKWVIIRLAAILWVHNQKTWGTH